MNGPLRILHLLGSSRPGGVESFVRDLTRHVDRDRYRLSVCVLGDDGPIAEDIRNGGTDVHILPGARRFEPAAAARYAALLHRGMFDIVHANTGGRFHRLVAKTTGATVIAHLHGLPEEWVEPLRAGGDLATRCVRTLPIGSDRIIGCSRWLATRLRSALPRFSDSIEWVYCGVDLERFSSQPVPSGFRDSLRISADASMIAFVGRLVRQKGAQYLMAAARILAQRKPDAVLLVVGDGPLHSLLENSASVAGLTNLRFLGEQTDVRPAIAACDMMVVPSEWEPFGIVSLEAMAMKKPVVAFDVDGIPEIIVHGNTGILVEHRNVDALVHALVALAEDPPARERMGESGRERVEEIFDSRATARNFEQIYQSLATRQA